MVPVWERFVVTAQGVSEYLVAPIDPVQLIRSIATLFADPEAPFTGKSIAINVLDVLVLPEIKEAQAAAPLIQKAMKALR